MSVQTDKPTAVEIRHRSTGAVLYTANVQTIKEAIEQAVKADANLHGANLCGADLRGAYLGSANLCGANLHGANLCGAKGILRLSDGQHDVIAFDTGQVSISCHMYDISRWLQSYRTVGKKEEYTDDEIADYGDRLELCAKWIARQKGRKSE